MEFLLCTSLTGGVVQDCTRDEIVNLIYYHGPKKKNKSWVHDSTRGVEGYLMNFHGPTITYPKLFQEVGP